MWGGNVQEGPSFSLTLNGFSWQVERVLLFGILKPKTDFYAGRFARRFRSIYHDSGQFRGQRHIRGGRSQDRSVLYMSAPVASRHTPILKALYLRLLDAGKPKKLALTALMRKLTILANRLLKNPNSSLAN